ncbi:MAG: discoidin domain-containing protein [Ruminococcaceae bacterium]|nr:discoidin domain-containing protein [Oscillospiraceae bacterium]
MKRFVSLLLLSALILSCIPMLVFAEETENTEELTNIARVENALAYASSEKNTLWTPAKALIDGKKNTDTWQGWEVGYPEVIYGANTSAGFKGQYCGVKFTNREYYEIYEVNLNLGLHAAMGGQNVHYLVQCLVEGVWVTVAEFSDSDTKPLAYASYKDAMEKDTSFYHIPAEYSFKIDKPITTNNFRITLSDYGKNYPGGDVLIFPYIYEIELIGKRGETPALELPEGAVISTNIGYHSYPKASSSADFAYPYGAIDGSLKTWWSPKAKAVGEYLLLDFIEAKKINKAVLNFGEYLDGVPVEDYKFDIEALVDGAWVKVATGTSFDEENKTLITEYSFDEVETSEIRVVFTEKYKSVPEIYEFEAHLSADKTYYVENRFDTNQRKSASKGNIAIIGTPYANRDFAPYSDVNYIIDGKATEDAFVWFTGVIDMPSYCGIKFNEPQLIDRVALYFYVPAEEGADIMDIQIQALVDGEYKTIVETKSYHKDLKYSPAFKFEPVETTDIRVYYTSGSGTFANMKELEVYSPNGIVDMFDGLSSMAEPPVFIEYPEKEQEPSQDSNSGNTPSSKPEQTPDSTVDSAPSQEEQQNKDDPTAVIVAISVMASLLAIAAAVAVVLIVKAKKK